MTLKHFLIVKWVSLRLSLFTKKNKELQVNKCFKKELKIKIYYLANNSLAKK